MLAATENAAMGTSLFAVGTMVFACRLPWTQTVALVCCVCIGESLPARRAEASFLCQGWGRLIQVTVCLYPLASISSFCSIPYPPCLVHPTPLSPTSPPLPLASLSGSKQVHSRQSLGSTSSSSSCRCPQMTSAARSTHSLGHARSQMLACARADARP